MSPAEYLLQVPANRIGYTTMNLGHHRGLLDQRRMGEAIITPSHGK